MATAKGERKVDVIFVPQTVTIHYGGGNKEEWKTSLENDERGRFK